MQDPAGCVLPAVPHNFCHSVQAVAVDGTSSTALLVDANTWDFLADAKMYFEAEDEQSVAGVQVCCYCFCADKSDLVNMRLIVHQQAAFMPPAQ